MNTSVRLIGLTVACLLSACRFTNAGTNLAPCAPVDRKLTEGRKKELAPIIAKQLGVASVDIPQLFAKDGWNIVYVDTHQSDEAFLFFPGEPGATHYVTLWGGAATEDEEQQIKEWTAKNAPGIPPSLASCFAWHVTRDRDR